MSFAPARTYCPPSYLVKRAALTVERPRVVSSDTLHTVTLALVFVATVVTMIASVTS